MSGSKATASILALATAAFFAAGRAEAATYAFSAQSLIIPMDICYQPAAGLGTTPKANYCPDPVGTPDDGLTKAYGLVYRLLQQGVGIYYIVEPTKATIDGVDLNVTAPAGTPVALYNRSVAGGGSTEFIANNRTNIAYRGAPFVIDSSDYSKVVALLAADSASATPVFKNVDIHVAKQGFTAPVAAVLTQAPPRIALLNIGGAAIGVLEGYLKDAGLFNGTSVAAYPAIGDVFTEFDNVTDFTTSNGLVAGKFQILWAPHWEGSQITAAQLTGVMNAISAFVDSGHSFFAQCAAIATIEGSTSGLTYGGTTASAPGNFMTTVAAGKTALITNKLPQPSWPNGVTGEGVKFDSASLTNPLVQVGDFSFVMNVYSWTFDFVPDTTHTAAFKTGVTEMITSTAPGTEPSYANRDIVTVMHKDNDPTKGLIIYLGGHSYGSQGSTCNPTCTTSTQTPMIAGERIILNSLIFLGQPVSSQELARSSPIVMPDKTIYQGTYVQQSAAATTYPPWAGHFRQYPPYSSSSAGVAFNQSKANWDAANGIPAAAKRTIFTAVTSNGVTSQVAFNTANAAQLGTPMGLTGTALTNAINGIIGGGLGGIDHSTPAIIEPSTTAGSATRPTVAYVGALDGMLHAIAISGTGVTAGTELWAFIPPSQLSKIAGYQAGVDGSPQVADAFIDATGSGIRSWRTVLAVPDGAFGGTVDVLDITDPLVPKYLWTASSTVTGYTMGAASGVSFGVIGGAQVSRSVIYMATNNLGTAGNGFNLYALDAGNGAVIWQWNHLYARHIPSTTTLVPDDVPGVPATADVYGDGTVTDRVYFGDLDGKLWEIDALLGTAPTGPLYDAGGDGYPFSASVSLFRDATTSDLSVVAASGGSDWVPSTIVPFVVAVDVQHHLVGNTGLGTTLWKDNLAAGERVYAAPTVAGSDVYLITSFGKFGGNIGTSISDLGNVRRIVLAGGAISLTQSVGKGASEVAVGSDGSIVAASAAGENILSNPNRDLVATALDYRVKPMTVEAWLDLH